MRKTFSLTNKIIGMTNKDFVRDKKILFALFGLFSAILGAILYLLFGYIFLIPILWIASIIMVGIYFYFKSNRNFKLIKSDITIMSLLLILFVPIYFYGIYALPFQMSTDEIVIMSLQKELVSQSQPDLFALSHHFGFPSLVFIFTGTLGNLLGGINLLNMRIVHAFFGLLIVPSSYLFFRALTKRKIALACAVILGINHSLVVISRMAMRENLALLGGLLALIFLLYGLRKKSFLYIFISGIFAALNWYGYYPGRSVIMICFLFLAILGVFYRDKYKVKDIIKYSIIILLGFLLIVLPLLTATIKQSEEDISKDAIKFQQQASLLSSQGRELQRENVYADSISEGVKTNIFNGITTYNNFVSDHGAIYVNQGHGFIDPLTGIFLWIGFLIILLRWNKDEKSFLILAGFLFYLLIFSFVVNLSPNYTRLLVTLPFVSYLSIIGLTRVSEFFGKIHKKLKPNHKFSVTNVVFVFFLLIIVSWNLSILGDFAMKGIDEGDLIGGTARYVEERKHIETYTFYLVVSDIYPYYTWGDPYGWKQDRIGFFANSSQNVTILSPEEMIESLGTPPFTIFMSGKLWEKSQKTIFNQYPNLTIYNIKPDGSKLAIEVK